MNELACSNSPGHTDKYNHFWLHKWIDSWSLQIWRNRSILKVKCNLSCWCSFQLLKKTFHFLLGLRYDCWTCLSAVWDLGIWLISDIVLVDQKRLFSLLYYRLRRNWVGLLGWPHRNDWPPYYAPWSGSLLPPRDLSDDWWPSISRWRSFHFDELVRNKCTNFLRWTPWFSYGATIWSDLPSRRNNPDFCITSSSSKSCPCRAN